MILVGGDSFTEKDFQGTTKWIHNIEQNPKKVINTAVRGSSNQAMLYRVLDTLLKRPGDISHVVIALTEWPRYPDPYLDTINLSTIAHDGRHWNQRGLECNKLYPTRPKDINRRVNEILMLMYTIMNLCVVKNKKFTCFQMLDYVPNKDQRARFVKEFARSDYVDLISNLYKKTDNTDLIDWPDWPAKPGIATQCRLMFSNEWFNMDEEDTHPSQMGHMFMADFIKDKSKFL